MYASIIRIKEVNKEEGRNLLIFFHPAKGIIVFSPLNTKFSLNY
jgi:hypothetical protein